PATGRTTTWTRRLFPRASPGTARLKARTTGRAPAARSGTASVSVPRPLAEAVAEVAAAGRLPRFRTFARTVSVLPSELDAVWRIVTARSGFPEGGSAGIGTFVETVSFALSASPATGSSETVTVWLVLRTRSGIWNVN